MAYSRAEAIGISLSHQSGEVAGDPTRLGVDRKVLLFRYPAEHESEQHAKGDCEAAVGRRAVAHDGRAVEVGSEASADDLDHRWMRLAGHDRFDSRCGRHSG